MARRIDHFVERGNHWSKVSQRRDVENYLNGNLKFAFEYIDRRRLDDPELIGGHRPIGPYNVAVASPHPNILQVHHREIGNLSPDFVAGKACIISRWNQKPVFVDKIGVVNKVEKFIPSFITVGFKPVDGTIQSHAGPMGYSVLYGYAKPCLCLGEGKLDQSLVSFGGDAGRDNEPVSMVERRAEVMDNVPTDERRRIYNGFVLFGERGALAGLCVCFDTVGERAIFAEQFAKISDVFRSLTNL